MPKITRAYRLKLYPNQLQANAMARHAGACRWLWNHLLGMQKEHHAKTGNFIFFHDMSKMLPGLKRNYPWLAEAPSNSLVRVCRNLDLALKDCFRKKSGFPRFKARGVSKESFYIINQAMRVEDETSKVVLPKLGAVRFKTGRMPEGRIVGANVSCRAGVWWCTVQCEIEEEIREVAPLSDTVVGVDLGLKDLIVSSDGDRVKAPKHLRAALKRLKRAQQVLARRKKGSANRRKQAARVARLHARVADQRRDLLHQATARIVSKSSVVVTEAPNVKGMMQNRRLALSFADAGWGEMLRQIGYKTAWSGKTHLKVGRFEPSTQTCSSCGTRKTGSYKLRLHHRTYRCDCGVVIDRDLNAALNLRQYGLKALGLEDCATEQIIIDVGRVTPERVRENPLLPAPVECPLPGGLLSQQPRRYDTLKQEVQQRATSYKT